MRLFVDIGRAEGTAKRGAVAGRAIAVFSEPSTDVDHGALIACSAGVADRPGAEQAAVNAAGALGDVYYAAAEAAPPRQALGEAFSAANLVVRSSGEAGCAATLGALVLQGRRWLAGYAGDVRVWQCRDQRIRQLSRDHVVPRALRRSEVVRACGLADTLEAEYTEGHLEEGDIFLLTSSGVHEALAGSDIFGVLQSDRTAQQMADMLVQRAAAAQAQGYLGVCVARIEKLPAEGAPNSSAASLPILDPPRPGTVVDGFVIGKLMIKGPRYRLYRAEDRETGETVALRFPLADAITSAQAFLREDWAGRHIESPFILKPIAVRPGRRRSLYSAMEHRVTENLAKRIRRKQGLPLSETLRLAGQLLAAVETLHEHGLLGRDIRANNLLHDKINRQLWVPGLGTPRAEAAREHADKARSSILSFWAPELFQDKAISEASDIYAVGVTIYRMLTAKYPYGRIRSPDDWKQRREYTPLNRYQEHLPVELDEVIARACAIDPARRYASVAEFTTALDAVAGKTQNEPAPSAPQRGGAAWPWWVAVAMSAGLLAYLYFALR